MFTLSTIIILATIVYITRRNSMGKVNVSEYVKARTSVREHIANHEYNVFGTWVGLSDNLLRYCLIPVSMNSTMLWTSFDIEYTRDRAIITVSYTDYRTFNRHEVVVTLGNSFTCSSEDYSGHWFFENLITSIEVYLEHKDDVNYGE